MPAPQPMVVPGNKAAWVPSSSVNQCPTCGEEFGLIMKRRHHCRNCGGVFCDDCSSRKARGIPGYNADELLRVCKVCYCNQLAYVVAFHQSFSFHFNTFDNLASAQARYDKIGSSSSRVLMHMGSGFIVKSYFARESWKKKIMTYAEAQIANRRVAAPPQAVPASAGQPAVTATVPPASPSAPLQQARRQEQPSSPPATSNKTRQPSLFVSWTTADNSVQHTWIPSTTNVDAALTNARMLLGNFSSITASVLTVTGEQLFTVNNTWLTSNGSVSTAAKRMMQGGGVTIGWHAGGEYRTKRISDNFQMALQEVASMGQETSLMVLDDHGSIVINGCPDASWAEGIAKHVGAELMIRQRIGSLVFCQTEKPPEIQTNLFVARRLLMSQPRSTLFAIAAESPTAPEVIQAHPIAPSEELLAKFVNDAQEVYKSTVSASAATLAAPAASATPPPASPAAPSIECGICMLSYDSGEGKPCLCPGCGNTMCLRCIAQVNNCPYCRTTIDPRNAITNVQLLQMVTGVV